MAVMPGKSKSAVSCSYSFCGLEFCTTTYTYNGLLEYILWGVHSNTRRSASGSVSVKMLVRSLDYFTYSLLKSQAAVTITVPCTSITATWAFTYLNDAFFSIIITIIFLFSWKSMLAGFPGMLLRLAVFLHQIHSKGASPRCLHSAN